MCRRIKLLHILLPISAILLIIPALPMFNIPIVVAIVLCSGLGGFLLGYFLMKSFEIGILLVVGFTCSFSICTDISLPWCIYVGASSTVLYVTLVEVKKYVDNVLHEFGR